VRKPAVFLDKSQVIASGTRQELITVTGKTFFYADPTRGLRPTEGIPSLSNLLINTCVARAKGPSLINKQLLAMKAV